MKGTWVMTTSTVREIHLRCGVRAGVVRESPPPGYHHALVQDRRLMVAALPFARLFRPHFSDGEFDGDRRSAAADRHFGDK